MKKLLLFLPVFGLGLVSVAQTALKDNKLQRYVQDRPVVLQQTQPTAPTHTYVPTGTGNAARATILNSKRIGSAGNLLTIIDGGTNQIDVNDSLNLITFIHRLDPNFNTGNIAQYSFDYSTDGGNNWTIDQGPITVNAAIDNQDVCGRFPQAVIYNAPGNTTAANATLVYSGTWHDNVTWTGQMRGRGQVGSVNSFDVAFPTVNGGMNAIGTGMVQSEPGIFFLVNQSSTQSFVGTPDFITDGIVISKGIWNGSDVIWSDTKMPATFQSQDQSGQEVSVVTSLDIAFSPDGQTGWIAALGDITAGDDSVYQPIFWKSTDAGATWSAPQQIELPTLQGIVENLSPVWYDGETPTSGIPTTAFDGSLTVDYKGNPHFLVSVGTGSEYSIEPAGYTMWDITYDTSSVAGCDWRAVYMDDILSLRGTMTSDNPAQTQDNRPLTSRTADGKKLFFFWVDTDINFLGSADNDLPNLFGKALDIEAGSSTAVYNFTEGDTLWGGATGDSEGGVFGGAKFPMVSSTALDNGTTYNVPLVLTQVDYNNDPSGGSLGSSEAPAGFWYINNIDFPAAGFTGTIDQTPPSVTLLGDTLVVVTLNGTYTEDSATAFDCTDGAITPTIVNAPNTSALGIYTVLYIATDAAGNSDTATRTVIVCTTPVADFSWSFPQFPSRPLFSSAESQNQPTSFSWTFGDGGGSSLPSPSRQYVANGTYNVCLTASNACGTSAQVCKQVVITGVGINDIEFAEQINVFPNPANDKVFVKIESDVTEQMTVSLVDMLGKQVTAPVVYGAGTTNMEISTANVANGLYFVKIQTEKTAAVKTISVNHN